MVEHVPGGLLMAGVPEPVAIIGMGCRFAGGVESPEAFWRFLIEGRDAVGEVPPGRWDWYASVSAENAAVLNNVTRVGAFLADIEGFDADFFGITPREAALMDPQQRIMLEVAWEALEHAGIPPRDLARTDTGVFIGVGSDDYGRRMLEDLPRIEAWTGIGGALCAVANRISHALDLRGPSTAVDTACSSSLVSIHLACQSLRARECSLAIAGGVLVMASPGLSIVLDAAGATSPDGRCKSFDAAADGYGRGEGAGAIVLKLLGDAVRDGDRILAVIRGSAVHQDGKTNGIMAPNGEAQEHLLRRAYAAAGIDPATVDYVEAHGTGTRVGDPLEARAMSAVFGAGRPAGAPCLIGSVKPNIGHLEAGAGVAGVIKTVLALQHGEIPPTVNFSKPNPAIPWDRSGLRVVAETTPWPASTHPRRAGVSAYGYGGTIAHVILEQAPVGAPAVEEPGTARRDGLVRAYPLSGASPEGVRRYADRLADWLAREDVPQVPDSVGYTLARRRSHLPSRAVVVAADRRQLIERLRAVAAGEPAPGVAQGTTATEVSTGTVWVFSGHGSQWLGMGRELLDREPAFAAVIDELEPIFLEEAGFSPREAIASSEFPGVDRIQSMIFAMQVGLAAVWRAYGLQPAAVIGHSVGEIAAAVTAGALDLEAGARLICRRSLLLRRVAGRGAMAMVDLPFAKANERLAGRDDVVAAIAASPNSTVISGDADAVTTVCGQWRAEGLLVRRVDSDVAFHSRHMDALVDDLAAAVADIPNRAPDLPVYVTALDDPRATPPRDGVYWAANLRNPVRFVDAVIAAVEDGYRRFLEVSPHPVVAHSINETLQHLDVDDACVAHTLRRNKPEQEMLLTNLGTLHCHGAAVDWAAAWPAGELADLPTTAWLHKPYWFTSGPTRASLGRPHDVGSHTLLGGQLTVNGTTPVRVWQTLLDRATRPYPGDHPVQGVEIIPAAVLINTFLAAGATDGVRSALADVSLRVPVTVTAPREIQVVSQDGTVRLASRPVDDEAADEAGQAWLTHATATLVRGTALDTSVPPAQTRTRYPEPLSANFVTERLASVGVPAMGFPWVVEEIRRGADGLLAQVSAGADIEKTSTSWASLLDAAVSIGSVAFTGPATLRMPAHIRQVVLAGDPPARALISVRLLGVDTVDVDISDLDGRTLCRLAGLRYGVLDGDPNAVTSPRRLVHQMTWRPLQPAGAGAPGRVILVGDDTALVRQLSEYFAAESVPCRAVRDPDDLAEFCGELGADAAVVVLPATAQPGEPVDEAAVRATWLLAATTRWLDTAGLAGGPRLWCVTQGVRESRTQPVLAHAPIWGLGRVVGGEHPELWGGIIDLAPEWSAADAALLGRVLASVRGEDVVVLRDGAAWVARLARVTGEPQHPAAEFRADGTYLITGGLGVLGLEIARWMAGRGARRIVLAGRRALPPREDWNSVEDPAVRRQIEAVRSLEGLGVTVRTLALDISDRDQAAKLLASHELGLPPIRGVVHAAGVLDNRMLRGLDEESLRTVMRPKVAGALVLHEMFPPGSVDFLVLFSSCGYLLGLTGQASYAAGNAFLDALATHRRSGGQDDTVSLAWTSWHGLGMSTVSAVIDAELAARGVGDITATEAFRAWEFAERCGIGYAAVLRTTQEPGVQRPAILAELDTEESGTAEQTAEEAAWIGLDDAELRKYLTTEVCRRVASEMKLATSQLDPHRPLAEMGLDSVMAVVIRRGLERQFRLSLPATLLWDRPTVSAVAELLAQRLRADGEPAGTVGAGGSRSGLEGGAATP